MIVAVLLAACSSGGIRGTFVDESGNSNLTFKSGNTVVVTVADVTIEMKYSVHDKKVSIIEQNGIVTELEFDGTDTLTGAMGIKYTRKKK